MNNEYIQFIVDLIKEKEDREIGSGEAVKIMESLPPFIRTEMYAGNLTKFRNLLRRVYPYLSTEVEALHLQERKLVYGVLLQMLEKNGIGESQVEAVLGKFDREVLETGSDMTVSTLQKLLDLVNTKPMMISAASFTEKLFPADKEYLKVFIHAGSEEVPQTGIVIDDEGTFMFNELHFKLSISPDFIEMLDLATDVNIAILIHYTTANPVVEEFVTPSTIAILNDLTVIADGENTDPDEPPVDIEEPPVEPPTETEEPGTEPEGPTEPVDPEPTEPTEPEPTDPENPETPTEPEPVEYEQIQTTAHLIKYDLMESVEYDEKEKRSIVSGSVPNFVNGTDLVVTLLVGDRLMAQHTSKVAFVIDIQPEPEVPTTGDDI